MFNYENFKSEIFFIDAANFESSALDVFQYQFHNNIIYNHFCLNLNKHPDNVTKVTDIPFLPIEFFKTKKVVSGTFKSEKIFKSSGTTGMERSRHYVKDLSFYHHLAQRAFETRYGKLADYEILALLPSYQEQGDSSLISMIDSFMSLSKPESSYYLDNREQLNIHLKGPGKKLLFGVSYALLDLIESSNVETRDLLVFETGGMKGRKKEMIREELHSQLNKGLGIKVIHSEYGMTELTSQAYGVGGFFSFPEWCRVLIRDTNDPFSYLGSGKSGGINIIDLGNIDSCSFIETKDLGKQHDNGTFEVLGRFDNSDVRGCNLLV